MARRRLLTDEERTALLGIPADPDALARLFTLSRIDRALVDAAYQPVPRQTIAKE